MADAGIRAGGTGDNSVDVRKLEVTPLEYTELSATTEHAELKAQARYRLLSSASQYVLLTAQQAYRRLTATTSSIRPYITTAFGQFLIFRTFADLAGVIDQVRRAFGKTVSDNAAVTDTAVKSLGRTRNDAAAASEAMFRSSGKSLTEALTGVDAASKSTTKSKVDTLSASDISIKSIGRSLSESTAAMDVLSKTTIFARTFSDNPVITDASSKTFGKTQVDGVQSFDVRSLVVNKALSDLAYATDDVNGASVGDDQIIQFFKSRSDIAVTQDIIAIVSTFSRVYSDAAYTSEVSTKAFGKSRVDHAVTSDSGFVRSQGYCDISYFMEDYVGATRTF